MDSHPNRLVQFNGEMIDFQLNLDVDHRKRRRNRTTQSCLNCHTSKRKCDRKRPCSRCIQLGLTGLCVYEVDDPAIRDDPNVDEVTKLRNRIAELESLVRELRGKPHPRWVDAGLGGNAGGDSDLSEKWHTRAFKKSAIPTAAHLSIKSEPDTAELSYRLNHHRNPNHLYPPDGRQGNYSPSPPLSMSTSSAGSSSSRDDLDSGYYHHVEFQNGGSANAITASSCRCLSTPAAASRLMTLTQQLQDTYNVLDRLPEHNDRGCVILDRIAELNNFLHSDSLHHSAYHSHPNGNGGPTSHSSSHSLPPHPNQQFSPLPSPHSAEFDHYLHHSPHHFSGSGSTPDSEMMSPESGSSGGSTFSPCNQSSNHLGSPWYQAVSSPNSSAGISTLAVPSGYNPYFPAVGSPHPLQQQQAAVQQNGYEIL